MAATLSILKAIIRGISVDTTGESTLDPAVGEGVTRTVSMSNNKTAFYISTPKPSRATLNVLVKPGIVLSDFADIKDEPITFVGDTGQTYQVSDMTAEETSPITSGAGSFSLTLAGGIATEIK